MKKPSFGEKEDKYKINISQRIRNISNHLFGSVHRTHWFWWRNMAQRRPNAGRVTNALGSNIYLQPKNWGMKMSKEAEEIRHLPSIPLTQVQIPNTTYGSSSSSRCFLSRARNNIWALACGSKLRSLWIKVFLFCFSTISLIQNVGFF